MNILFLCTANLNRSKTSEILFRRRYPAHEFKSAGLSKKYCMQHKTTLCTESLLKWADKIYVMEQMHLERIKQHTGETYLSKIINLNIEDKFKFDESKLVAILLSKVLITDVGN
jgi:predicted protein tyrosine phosphatase